MKNLLITNVFPPKTGGSGRWFWEIYRRLPRAAVTVVAGRCDGDGLFDAGHDLDVIREDLAFSSWGIVGVRKSLRYLAMFRRLKQIVRQRRITAVDCGTCLPEGLLGLMLKRWCAIPCLCYIHGEELAIAQSSRELRWLANKVLAGCDLVVANSRHTQELLLNDWKLPPERVRLLHPGVDTGRFQPAPPSQDVRTRLGWGDRPVVLTVGRLQARKGHDCLIRSLQAVKQRIPNVLYAIVGDGEQRTELDALVTSEGLADHVVFHGELRDEDLIDCYQQCDLFALPNRQVGKDFEGFGMVLLEAQACGRPVIAGTSGGTAETMSIPATGRLVCCDDPQPLADALIDLLRDRERLNQMGQAARRWVVENFDWDSLSLRAMEIFASVEATDVAFATAPSESTAKSKIADDAVAGISA